MVQGGISSAIMTRCLLGLRQYYLKASAKKLMHDLFMLNVIGVRIRRLIGPFRLLLSKRVRQE